MSLKLRISVDNPSFAEKINEYRPILKRAGNIPMLLESAAKALKPYEEYL